MTRPRLAVVGNPDNRRVTMLFDAAARHGMSTPRVVSWREVLTARGARFDPDELVRLDSPGEDPDVDALLRGPGDPTRIADGTHWYASLIAAVGTLRGGRLLTDPDDLAVLFDKRRCHAALAGGGVPVPLSPTSGSDAPAPRSWPEVRELVAAAGLRRFFLKPAHGSSAAGVVAVETAPGGRVQARSSAEIAADGVYNSLRVRRFTGEAEVGALVDALAGELLHIEAWLPKPSSRGRTADLRVVVVAGRATHAVVRTSTHPMTNLHLGGQRGDLEAVRAAFDSAGYGWESALAVAESAAARFPRTLCVGVDLLPAADWRGAVVGEVNAFGDLLPGLTGLPGRADGLDTYEAQLSAIPGWAEHAAA
ncbi:glutathione synthase/RimK-type ligase-like ATP-grasp enzyme [Rhodococcus sp. LBL1]|nr:glutathione synthase/RimK-type ligase-like ATP-grasp enzyme [Rhodococcus sp. LBL1]MDH6681132.1 glutathione synthase/RimK-type ligase-like ATP-grasp enzyme [Rhodococcus sp. LBL2]